MFRAIFGLSWQWLRGPLCLLSLLGAGIPMLGVASSWDAGTPSVDAILASANLAGILIAVVAVLAGAIAGDVLWRQDARRGHSYAMSLPVRREVFLRYRAASGALLLLLPAFAIFVGIASVGVLRELPPGVNTYAWDTALRSWVAMLLALALTLGVRQGLGARGRRVLLGVGLALTMTLWLEPQLTPGMPRMARVVAALFSGSYSPFAVIFSPWPLVDL